MEYRIIFYNASKTAICERTIIHSLSPAGFTLAASSAAATKQILGNHLSGGFVQSDLMIVVAGSDSDDNGAFAAISSAIDSTKNVKCERLGNFNAYLFTCDDQALLILPDIVSDISAALDTYALKSLKEFFDPAKGVGVTA